MGRKRKLQPKSETTRTNVTEQEQQQQQQEEQLEELNSSKVEEEPLLKKVKEEVKEEPQAYVREDAATAAAAEEEVDEDEDETDNAPKTSDATALSTPPAEQATANSDGAAAAAEDDDIDTDGEEPVQQLLEPFAKEQLIDILREAADKHTDVVDRIRELADVDPVHRKIFVHGLGWDTNVETLTSSFLKYGEIEDCNAVRDKISGKSKGYGFILFKHRRGARNALKEPQKWIGNRMTACQLASAGPVPPPMPTTPPVSEYTQRKIFVSNVSADIDPQKLVSFFAKYGEIEEGPLGLDKHTGKPKGFALFVYKSIESAKNALEEPHKNLEGHVLHCQKAIDGPKPNKPYHPQHHHHPPGGSHFRRNEKPNFNNAAGPGHLMAPSATGLPFNQGVSQSLNPAIGQAITALLATQGAGLGLTNLLGTIGSTGIGPQVNNTGHGMQVGYGNQVAGSSISPGVMGGYGNQPGMQGGYLNSQIGQGSAGRSHQGAGHMGGVNPYMGR